ncbi:hypothetical protein AGLY_016397 [Aphis glycines]|uniref:DNA-directed DNA polymerase n=1 Tax=Aphis glycines TaxID=307491 RepID=A0A6G0SYY2_APHGL|nr:hypothetical protein AGLY_016397 [Aphis glycines]
MFNLKLEATYNIPNVDNSTENRSFKTSARPFFSETVVREIVEEGIIKLMAEQDEYSSKVSGYTLQCIDGLLLGVYQYTPMNGLSYIPLPDFIERKKAVINPQNSDQQCFKWAILAKHVTGSKKQCIENYTTHEEKYNFSDLTFPTKLHQVNIFEKNNPNVTVNVYGLEKHFQPPQKFPKYEVFPQKVVDEEKKQHFDLLLITDYENSHFIYISNFSRLVRSQKIRHNARVIFSLLKKFNEKCGNNTKVIQKHEAMSYGFMVIANSDVPAELLEQFNIPTSPIIFRGGEDNKNVGEHFVKSIVEIAENIEKLLQTNIPITFTAEQQQAHILCKTCNLCKNGFSVGNHKVADHCHLSGKFRQTLCNTCNLKLQTPNFVPCFFHNLSNYDAHFIVTELGLDVKRIFVIPNSEEKFISFSKHVSNNFSIRFIDTLRFMASSVYPYEYTDGWNKLEQTHLPEKADFYSTLTESHMQKEDYDHAKTVWSHIECKTLGEYSDQ